MHYTCEAIAADVFPQSSKTHHFDSELALFSNIMVMSGIVPLQPCLLNVGVFPTLAITMPILVAMLMMRFRREFIVIEPHSKALLLKSHPIMSVSVLFVKLSSMLFSFSMKFSILLLGVS